MAHLALYRQFRPKTFDEVVAQEHIVQTLKHQIQNGTINHAYLFCGTRGTGKTSCAKIFSKAVNCLNPKNGSPCGECEVCKKIASGFNLDIVEIDAASNNRVDEIRDLRDKVGYLPSVGKYKVYIIDEVHMLTDSAFNALLKTLEEPPAHIIFILATTEPDKLPATILSRCMRFDFKLVDNAQLAKQLAYVFNKTGTKYEAQALELIAKAGAGSVRDTLSVAEMCKAFSNDNITYKSVQECLGLTDDETLFEIAKAIINKDSATVLQKVNELFETGKNLNVFLADLCDYFNNILSIKLAPNYGLKVPTNILDDYKHLANMTSEKYLLDCLKRICDNLSQIKYSLNIKIFVETTLLSLFYNDNLEIEMLKQKVENLQNGIVNYEVSEVKKNLIKANNLTETNNLTQTINIQPLNETTQSHVFEKEEVDLNKNSQNVFNSEKDENKNLNDTQSQKVNQIFGDLIKYIRESGQMLLFAGLSDVKDVEQNGSELVFICSSQEAIDIIEKNKKFILEYLKLRHNINNITAKMYQDKSKQLEQTLNDLLDNKVKIE